MPKRATSKSPVVLPNGQPLRGGPRAVSVLYALQGRGLSLNARDNNVLGVSPAAEITEADDSQLQRHKSDLLALIRSEAVEH